MSEESPPYILPPLAPGEALEVMRQVAQRYPPPPCACAACSHSADGLFYCCARCQRAGCRPFQGLVYCRPAGESEGVTADDLGDIRRV